MKQIGRGRNTFTIAFCLRRHAAAWGRHQKMGLANMPEGTARHRSQMMHVQQRVTIRRTQPSILVRNYQTADVAAQPHGRDFSQPLLCQQARFHRITRYSTQVLVYPRALWNHNGAQWRCLKGSAELWTVDPVCQKKLKIYWGTRLQHELFPSASSSI